MFRKNEDGTFSLTRLAWAYVLIAAVVICWISVRTQLTANEQEDQARITTEFTKNTNECLTDVARVLTTRVGYNEAIDGITERMTELDERRQNIWDTLVEDLSRANEVGGVNRMALHDALAKFTKDNDALKVDQAKARADQMNLVQGRAQNQYPNCPQNLKLEPVK